VTAKRILVLDDSPITLEVTQIALEEEGFDVATATDLDGFEQRRAERAPDLILVDVQMPEAFGDDVATTLRGARGVRTPIFLLSGLEDAELERRAAEAEVDGWISKNAGVDELVRRVRQILA
jgi:DNA-binding response OmpR family regulator